VLLRNPGKLLSHRQLLNEVWGPGYDNAGGNLRLYMAQLRRKLEPDPARPRWLITEPGMGYRYQPPDHDQDHDQERDQDQDQERDQHDQARGQAGETALGS
jgi:DNA-binding winged helix-turn-helix (wHTH) protein